MRKGVRNPRILERPFFLAEVRCHMPNLCIVLGYDGTRFNGFQIQPSGTTIQGELQRAIEHLTGEVVTIHGSGRTDAGVHARAQVISFHTSSRIPEERWCLALNSRLPDDIVCNRALIVPDSFHARYSAKRKTYRYTVNPNWYPDVFLRSYQYHHPTVLDVKSMRHALSVIVGEHDFTSFCSSRTSKQSHVRTIYETKLVEEPDTGVLHFYVTGNGFLYHMVRILAGTLLEVGEGKKSPQDMANILEARNRKRAGPTAMAHGLMLWQVDYEELS